MANMGCWSTCSSVRPPFLLTLFLSVFLKYFFSALFLSVCLSVFLCSSCNMSCATWYEETDQPLNLREFKSHLI